MELWYFAHRLSDRDPVVRSMNLARAKEQFWIASRVYQARGITLWAPWIEMAEANVPEDEAWLVIEKCVRISSGIVLDLDRADEPSPGMVRERKMAEAVGAKVEVVR